MQKPSATEMKIIVQKNQIHCKEFIACNSNVRKMYNKSKIPLIVVGCIVDSSVVDGFNVVVTSNPKE